MKPRWKGSRTSLPVLGLLLLLRLRLACCVECPQPAAPVNAQVQVGGTSPGALATYTCDPGYDLFGSDSVVCGGDGRWTGALPLCATNVAYRKPVNQSSTARGGDGELANDGDVGTLHDGEKCSQTLVETSPWWGVDLLQQYEVAVVRVTARGCCGHDPLQDLEVRVGDSVNYHQNRLCAWLPGVIEAGSTRDLTCARPMYGRYVMVQMVGVSGALSLCEVQVFSTQEVSKERCSASSLVGSLATFNRTCYHFQTQQGGTYEVAKSKCEAEQATLVQHIAPITQDFLSSELRRMESSMTSKLLWIGVEKEPKHTSRVWRWVDGSEVQRPLWAKDQPNNYIGDQNCVMLDGSKQWLWNDIKCSLNYVHWICQYSAPSCGSPDKRENTTVAVKKEDLHGERREVATYSCPEGNKVIGDSNRTCGLDGLWAGEAPSCKYIDCGAPSAVEHGKLVLLDARTTYAARALYECAENYTLDGTEDTIACGDDGEWVPSAPHCLFSWCPPLDAPRDGGLEVTGRRAGDTATFFCNPGYTLLGAKAVSCQLGGEWSDQAPTCRFVDCGIPDDLEHGQMTLANGTTYLASVATYECDADYWLDGPKERTCMRDGSWTGDAPFCVLINCGEPEIPHGGYVTGYSFDVGAEVQYHCEVGHYSTGEMRRICTREATWSGVTPNCTFVDCGRVLPLVRGEVRYLSEGAATFLGAEVQHVCHVNYRLVGDEVRTCTKAGTWSGLVPRCEEIRCSNPVVPDLARISISRNDRRLGSVVRSKADLLPEHSYKVGSTITYRCDKGHVVEGATTRTCTNNGTWSSEAPSCKFVDCGLPDPISPGVFRLLSNETSYGATVSYECDPNWKVEGRFRRFCLENGTWSGPTPKCVQIQCPPLSSMSEGRSVGMSVDEGPRTVGSQATYSCDPGYSLVGRPERACLQHGVWEEEFPSCQAVVCPEPEEILNGRMLKLNGTTTYGSVVEYLCFPKYHLHGAFQRSCTQSGTWSEQPPTCSLDDTDLGVLGDNTVEGSTNSARGSSGGEEDGGSSGGLVAGLVVSLLVVVAVATALAFFRMRQRKQAKTGGGGLHLGGHGKAPDGGPINGVPMTNAGVVSYGGLSDPTTGNNIYENIPDDLDPDPNYSELSSPPSDSSRYSSHTYSNGRGGMGGYPPNQRPRLPPPQPPVAPTTAVTINGMAINGS